MQLTLAFLEPPTPTPSPCTASAAATTRLPVTWAVKICPRVKKPVRSSNLSSCSRSTFGLQYPNHLHRVDHSARFSQDEASRNLRRNPALISQILPKQRPTHGLTLEFHFF